MHPSFGRSHAPALSEGQKMRIRPVGGYLRSVGAWIGFQKGAPAVRQRVRQDGAMLFMPYKAANTHTIKG
jgi:hypothetical protein